MRPARRIGIDVGGTNTDAAVVEGSAVVEAFKTPTTDDVVTGVANALAGVDHGDVGAVIVGTTHFTNAVVQRRGLNRIGFLRIGLPAGRSLPPLVGWPPDLASAVAKHINVEGNVDYGLGWFLRQWNGRRVIDHAGGIDGFTAEVAMIPEENLGFVLLMNLFASPLQDESREIVFKAMLEDWTEDEALVDVEDFEPFDPPPDMDFFGFPWPQAVDYALFGASDNFLRGRSGTVLDLGAGNVIRGGLEVID